MLFTIAVGKCGASDVTFVWPVKNKTIHSVAIVMFWIMAPRQFRDRDGKKNKQLLIVRTFFRGLFVSCKVCPLSSSQFLLRA